jgi:hypothetical protein
MNRHIDDVQLNDYVEGLLTEDVARLVDVHVAGCEECSGRLEALALLLTEFAGLPDAATPARDLWAGVRAEIEAGSGHYEEEDRETGADVSSTIPVGSGRSITTRRFSFSGAQLLAASVVWTLLSGGVVWMVLSGGPEQTTVAGTDLTAVPEARSESGGILPVTQVAILQYEQAIASLEAVLEQGRDQLNPQTVATIEASLATIDRAIEEALGALVENPNNEVLNRLLIKHQQSKLRVLRQASAAVQI